MKSELKEIRLDKLDPNPFRDGSGSATWKSVADVYGFDEDKIAELQQSYATNGVWAGVHVRESGGRFQLAFGHHRVEAARRSKIERIPVVVAELGDDEMLKMMAAENSEEYGHDFALGVMNAVEAVVKAYAAGSVELEKPGAGSEQGGGTQKNKIRHAPSFLTGGVEDGPLEHPYTGFSVARYLGWTETCTKKELGVQTSVRILTALAALELIERGALKRQQFKGLGSTLAKNLVDATRAAMAKADVEAKERAARVEALRKAEVAAEAARVKAAAERAAWLAKEQERSKKLRDENEQRERAAAAKREAAAKEDAARREEAARKAKATIARLEAEAARDAAQKRAVDAGRSAAQAHIEKRNEWVTAGKPHISQNSGDNEWYTPPNYTDAARIAMGKIDLDPASSATANASVKAEEFYTAKDNGLTKKWRGTVWMNPPYAQPLCGQFAEKLASEYEAGNVTAACVLVNNATETGWFKRLERLASAVVFPEGRVKFWAPDKVAAPLQGQAVIYLGKRPAAFADAFKKFGVVWTK